MMKLLLKFVPIDTVINYLVEIGVAKLNDVMVKQGAKAVVERVAEYGLKCTAVANEIAKVFEDARIDEDEKKEILEKFVPEITLVVNRIVK